MTAGWECVRCGQLHTQNPASCRNCGHVIFNTLSESELQDRSSGVDAPEAMDLDDDRVMGTAPDDTGAPSPDVALDGSVAGSDDDRDGGDDNTNTGLLQRIRSIFPF